MMNDEPQREPRADADGGDTGDTASGASVQAFEEAAAQSDRSAVGEVFAYLGEHKKYWLIPTIAVLILLGVLAWVGGSGGGFIYALF